MTSRDPSDFVTLREFDRTVKIQDDRHASLVIIVEDIKAKHGEQRDQLRDIRALLIAMLIVCAPNLVTGILAIVKAVR